MQVYTIQSKGSEVRHLPLTPRARTNLEAEFTTASAAFFKRNAKAFDAGYLRAEDDEYLELDFDLPTPLVGLASAVPSKMAILSADEIKSGWPDALLVTLSLKSNLWCFQALDSRNFIRPAGRTFLTGKNTFDTPELEGLVFDSRIDAVFRSSKLCFRSSHMVRRILDISEHVKELSNAQLESLFSSSDFKVPDMDKLKEMATSQYRKKLALVQDSLADRKLNKAALQRAANLVAAKDPSFKLKLKIKGGQVEVPEDKDQFEDLVRLLNNDYLEAIGDSTQLFVSSSKRRLG